MESHSSSLRVSESLVQDVRSIPIHYYWFLIYLEVLKLTAGNSSKNIYQQKLTYSNHVCF